MTTEVERMLGCLYLACHAEVAADVERIVRAALKAKDEKIEETERKLASLQPQLRPEVLAFALLMEERLKANDHKPGWKNDRPGRLLDRLEEETGELAGALVDRMRNRTTASTMNVVREAADVANFAMMIADVCGGFAPCETPK